MRPLASDRPSDRHTRARAFSFIELAIVLIMIAVTAAIAIPRYGQSLARSRVEALAQRIASDIQGASDAARARSADYHIFFAPSSDRYRLAPGPASRSGVVAGQQVVNVAADPYGCQILNASFASDPGVTFNGYGVPSASGYVTVGCKDDFRRISLDEGGHVSVAIIAKGTGTDKETPPDLITN